MSAAIFGPFKLAQPEPTQHGGEFVDLDAANHGGIATFVWRMADDERSPECEAFAHKAVRCLNTHDDLVLVLRGQLIDLYNPFEPSNQSNTYLKYAALYEAATGEKVPPLGF